MVTVSRFSSRAVFCTHGPVGHQLEDDCLLQQQIKRSHLRISREYTQSLQLIQLNMEEKWWWNATMAWLRGELQRSHYRTCLLSSEERWRVLSKLLMFTSDQDPLRQMLVQILPVIICILTDRHTESRQTDSSSSSEEAVMTGWKTEGKRRRKNLKILQLSMCPNSCHFFFFLPLWLIKWVTNKHLTDWLTPGTRMQLQT